MKQNHQLESFYRLKGSGKFMLLILSIFLISLTSCSKDELNDTLVQETLDLKSSAGAASTTINEIKFTATALIADCHKENIRFTGTIQNRVTKNVDGQGVVHYTRSFSTKDMTGVGINPETGKETNTKYEVLGGAEMFAIKDAVLNPDGSLNLSGSIAESDIVIHQGTLVFRNLEDGSKVVARHIIRKVPGNTTTLNIWKCGGKE